MVNLCADFVEYVEWRGRGGGGTAKKSTILRKSLLEVLLDIVCALHLLNQSLSERVRERKNNDKERDERKNPRNDKHFLNILSLRRHREDILLTLFPGERNRTVSRLKPDKCSQQISLNSGALGMIPEAL